MVLFGQIVIGPPGAGKTSYCQSIQTFCFALGRKCEIINIDFANDSVPYVPSIDVRELVSLENVMEEFDLGPNGGMVYCMEYLLEHVDWLIDRIKLLDTHYLIIDCPGQVELFSHHNCVQDLLTALTRSLDLRLCSIHLVDSFFCHNPPAFLSSLLVVSSSMLRLALPHLTLLSKIDLLSSLGPLPLPLSSYLNYPNTHAICRFMELGWKDKKEDKGKEKGKGKQQRHQRSEKKKKEKENEQVDIEKREGEEEEEEVEEEEKEEKEEEEGDEEDGEEAVVIEREGNKALHNTNKTPPLSPLSPLSSSSSSTSSSSSSPSSSSSSSSISRWFQKYKHLCRALSDVLGGEEEQEEEDEEDDYRGGGGGGGGIGGMVFLMPFSIKDAELVGRVLASADQCNGYSFSTSILPPSSDCAENDFSRYQNREQEEQEEDEVGVGEEVSGKKKGRKGNGLVWGGKRGGKGGRMNKEIDILGWQGEEGRQSDGKEGREERVKQREGFRQWFSSISSSLSLNLEEGDWLRDVEERHTTNSDFSSLQTHRSP